MKALVRVLSWTLVVGLVALVVVGVVGSRSGYRLEIVRSGSMRPAFAPGDVVVVSPVSGAITPGQVVTFRHSNRSDDLVTHRVTDVTSSGIVHTKGDANTTADVWDVRPDQVEGVERLVVPHLGYAIVFLRNPRGLAAVLCILVALLLVGQTLLAARRGEGPFDAILGRHASTDRAVPEAVSGWVTSAPPPGFGRLRGCHYPCVVVEDGTRSSGRVFAWQQSDTGWRALVGVTRTDDAGRTRTDEQWFALASLEPVGG